MNFAETRQRLESVTKHLAEMDLILSVHLAKVDSNAETEQVKIAKEIRILDSAIDDAGRRRRWSVVESLTPKKDELLDRFHELSIAAAAAKQQIKLDHFRATHDAKDERDQLARTLDAAAALARQREMQERMHRKIPVMR